MAMTETNGMKIKHAAYWNTGNGYTEFGQRIGAVELNDGRIVFVDIDRHIQGVIPTEYAEGADIKERVKYGYMHNEVEYWSPSKAGFDYANEKHVARLAELERLARQYAKKAPVLRA